MYHWVLVLPLLGLILFIFLSWRLALPFYLAILVVSLGGPIGKSHRRSANGPPWAEDL
jgi:hypothetical protein